MDFTFSQNKACGAARSNQKTIEHAKVLLPDLLALIHGQSFSVV